jgi:putative SOS response-associated peptidase YedK
MADSVGRRPINAKCETVSTQPTFRDAYRLRRCILQVDGFYEWKAIKGQRAKQPLCHCHEGRRAIWDCGLMGELEEPGVL